MLSGFDRLPRYPTNAVEGDVLPVELEACTVRGLRYASVGVVVPDRVASRVGKEANKIAYRAKAPLHEVA